MAERELKTTEDVFDENMRLAEKERNRLKGIKDNTKEEKPFYVSQLPEGVQNKLKDMQKKKLLEEGYSKKDAEYYADEFLNEKIYTAEEIYGNDFWKNPEFAEETEEPKEEVEVKEEVKTPAAYKGHLEEENPPKTDITEEDVKRFGKEALKGLSGKKAWEEEDDELDAYTKDLEDYLDKNPDAKKKNYY